MNRAVISEVTSRVELVRVRGANCYVTGCPPTSRHRVRSAVAVRPGHGIPRRDGDRSRRESEVLDIHALSGSIRSWQERDGD